MSRVHALVVAVVVAVAAFVAERLLAGAADPDLPEPVVVEGPGSSAPDPTEPRSSPATPEPRPPASWDPSIVPPPTVGRTGPPTDDDDGSLGEGDADDASGGEVGGEAGEADDG
jgi:hypothetical protein